MIKDLRLCFREEKDIEKTKKKPTPPSDKMEKKIAGLFEEMVF